jgi:rRNA maturation RNase YbeY
MSDVDTLALTNTTRSPTPRVAFAEIKRAILGRSYDLSVAFVGTTRSQQLNTRYKQKAKPATVLSFPLDDNAGEIVICLPYAKQKAPSFGIPYRDLVGFLFIHGLLHLKGMDHGSTMEKRERALCRRFSLACPH